MQTVQTAVPCIWLWRWTGQWRSWTSGYSHKGAGSRQEFPTSASVREETLCKDTQQKYKQWPHFTHLINKQNDKVSLVFCNGKKKNVLTFSDVSQFEVVTAAEGIACPGLAVMFGYVSLVLWQRARQEPEGNAGDEQEAGRNQEAHPPGAHPPGIFRSDGHTFWMMGNRCFYGWVHSKNTVQSICQFQNCTGWDTLE